MKYELNNIGGDSYLIYSEGHHDLKDFTEFVKQEYEEWGNFFNTAYHHYYRKYGNQYSTWYEPCLPFTRGAFKVTVAQEGWDYSMSDLSKRIAAGDLIASLGNWYVMKHHYMKNKLTVWYSSNDCVATEIRSFDSLSEAKAFIEKMVNEGKL